TFHHPSLFQLVLAVANGLKSAPFQGSGAAETQRVPSERIATVSRNPGATLAQFELSMKPPVRPAHFPPNLNQALSPAPITVRPDRKVTPSAHSLPSGRIIARALPFPTRCGGVTPVRRAGPWGGS